jgi:hypothetical protein
VPVGVALGGSARHGPSYWAGLGRNVGFRPGMSGFVVARAVLLTFYDERLNTFTIALGMAISAENVGGDDAGSSWIQ